MPGDFLLLQCSVMYLTQYPEVARLVADLHKYPFSQASQRMLDRINIELKIVGDVPTKGPVLFVANHESALDALFCFAAITRVDLFFVGLAFYAEIGAEIKKRLLPVVRKKTYKDWFIQLFSHDWAHIISNPEKITEINRSSITKAAKLVSDGNAVLLFPSGSAGKLPKQGTWKKGLGYLLTQVSASTIEIVFVKIEHAKAGDLVRVLFGRFFPKKTVSITFYKPMTLQTSALKKQSPEKISNELEEQYNELTSY